MEAFSQGLNALNGIVWGVPMLVLILGTGLFLQIRLKMMPIAKIGYGIKLVWQGRKSGSTEDGEISPFAALMTALAATVGTGNIAGVATAIALGGPGALFWMWCTALVGMATKYAEVLLAVHYREVDENGEHVGGPMYAIKNGLGPNWRWLGVAFALTAGVAGFGIGNMVQANAIAGVAENTFGVPVWITGIVLTVVTGAVILGGIKLGVVTPTEAAVIAAFYALFVGMFVYRELRLSDLPAVLISAGRTTAAIMFLVCAALVSAWLITAANIPAEITGYIEPLIENPKLLMLAIMILILIVGTALDLTPTILILTPVLMPIITKAGIDPIYFGVMFIMNCCIGLLTPPVGVVLNVVSGVGRVPLGKVIIGVWPFLVAQILVLLLLVAFPGIVIVPANWFH